MMNTRPMMNTCPVCGKRTVIYWPQHWIYRRGEKYYCSEDCMFVDMTRDLKLIGEVHQKRRKEACSMGKHRLTLEQKKKAVEIANQGGDPLDYLKKCGSKNPSAAWHYIKQKINVTDPQPADELTTTAEPQKLSASNGELMSTDASEEEAQSETNESKPLRKFVRVDDYEVTAIRHPDLGEFYYDKKYGSVDWRSPEGEEISLTPQMWRKLYEEIPVVMGILRVEGDKP